MSEPTEIREKRPDALQDELVIRVLTALVEGYGQRDAASQVSFEQASVDALLLIVAAFHETDSSLKTRRDIRERGETMARVMRLQIEQIRDRFERNGVHLLEEWLSGGEAAH